ncbi:MAG: glycosyltransferase family protein, partial [Acidimicrobiales bacterium]
VPNAAVLLAHGSETFGSLSMPPGADGIRLPGLRKDPGGAYVARRLALPADDLTRVRTAVLAAAVDSFRPDVMLVDKHPTGVSGELLPALEILHEQGGTAVLGLRDVLDDPARVRADWIRHDLARAVARHYDAVLIYGRRDVFDLIAASGLDLTPPTHFCGYVTGPVPEAPTDPAGTEGLPLVLGSAGGGEDGAEMLACMLEAAEGAPWRTVVVCGPLADPATRRSMLARADQVGVELLSQVGDLGSWLDGTTVAVTMGGYNTLLEALARGIGVVCVPRVWPRLEQLVRAQTFSDRGLLHMLPPDRLTPDALRSAVTSQLEVDRPERAATARRLLGFEGASVAAVHLANLARNRADPASHLSAVGTAT